VRIIIIIKKKPLYSTVSLSRTPFRRYYTATIVYYIVRYNVVIVIFFLLAPLSAAATDGWGGRAICTYTVVHHSCAKRTSYSVGFNSLHLTPVRVTILWKGNDKIINIFRVQSRWQIRDDNGSRIFFKLSQTGLLRFSLMAVFVFFWRRNVRLPGRIISRSFSWAADTCTFQVLPQDWRIESENPVNDYFIIAVVITYLRVYSSRVKVSTDNITIIRIYTFRSLPESNKNRE